MIDQPVIAQPLDSTDFFDTSQLRRGGGSGGDHHVKSFQNFSATILYMRCKFVLPRSQAPPAMPATGNVIYVLLYQFCGIGTKMSLVRLAG